jgi:signal transduction histidine kinase
MKTSLAVALFWGLFFTGHFLFAKEGKAPVQLKADVESIRLDYRIEYFIDKTDTLSLDEILTNPDGNTFLSTQKRGLVFGYEPHSIWLRFTIEADAPTRNWLLQIPAPFLEFVDFYEVTGLATQQINTGYYLPHSTRPVKYSGFAFPVLRNGNTSTVYLRISGSSPKTFPVLLIQEDEFDKQVLLDNVGYGFFFGILCAMFLYNLIIYISLRLTTYLLYIGTLLCTILIFASASGYGGMLLWPGNPEFNYYFGRLTLAFFGPLLAWFAIAFLEVKRHYKWWYYYLVALMVAGVFSFVLMVTALVPSFGNNLVALTASSLIVTGILTRIKNQKSANFFIAAWSVYLVGGVMLTLRNAGLLEFNFWTTHLAEIGAACETVIIALALADRYRLLKEENEKAQKLALTLQQEANEKLEQQVAERTEQLSLAVEELNSTLQKNQLQTRVIEYKNAELDAFFYGVSHDLKSPLSSLFSLTQVAKEEVTDGNAQEYFNLQLEQIARIDRILKDLVLLAKLDHGNIPRQPVDFTSMLNGCLQSVSNLPNYHKIVFDVQVQPEIDYKAEWIFVNTILQNLIENAVKYSATINPCVWITVANNSDNVVLCVKDNGMGIHEEYLTKIFELFFRATQTSTGSGLGLYILSKSVKRLSGSVNVKSKINEGSEFTVTLPKDYIQFDAAQLLQE